MFLFILTWVRIAEGFTLNAWMEMEFNPNPGAVKTGGLPGLADGLWRSASTEDPAVL